jgi:hypothetical protein
MDAAHTQTIDRTAECVVRPGGDAPIVGGASAAGLDPRVAKLCAIVVRFMVTWLLRKRVVFR